MAKKPEVTNEALLSIVGKMFGRLATKQLESFTNTNSEIKSSAGTISKMVNDSNKKVLSGHFEIKKDIAEKLIQYNNNNDFKKSESLIENKIKDLINIIIKGEIKNV